MVAITKTLCAIAAASSVAMAVPTGGKGNSPKCTGQQAKEACAAENKVVACKSVGGLFNALNIPVVSLLLQVTALCSTQTVACCSADQDAVGLVVIQNSCSPIDIL